MIEGIKKSWQNASVRRKQSRELMIKYCHPKAWSSETNRKRVESRGDYRHSPETIEKIRVALKGRPFTRRHKKALRVPKCRAGSLGLKRTNETKQKLSAITKKQWKNGVHIPTYRSKGQQEVAGILRRSGHDVKEEFFINGKPYDVFVQDTNLVIEFNGTFWHRDPRFYDKSDTCQKIWDHDKEKMEMARQAGHGVAVIWQHDWEHACNKKHLLESIVNGTN